MKKVLIAALLLTGTQGVFAQINQGQWLVGGNAGFNSSKQGDSDDDKETSFTLSPNVGYFFINNLAGGLRVNLQTSKVKSADDGSTYFTVAPFARYYFLPTGQKVNVFADASYGFGSMGFGGESDGVNSFAFAAGPAVFLSPNTALEFTLNYSSLGGDAIGDDRMNNFGVNVGFQIHLGNAKK